MKFDDMVSKYIAKNGNVLDIPKNPPSLCTDLFSFQEGTPPVLKESIRLHILSDIERIAPYIKILNFYITGKCLQPISNPDKQCNVNVVIEFANYNDDETSHRRAYIMAQKLSSSNTRTHPSKRDKHESNKRYLGDTQHEIFYHLYNKTLSQSNLAGIYDVFKNKWIKVPKYIEIEDEDNSGDN
jgi:hypothetical protein